MEITVKLKGTSPLLHHADTLVDSFHPLAKEMKEFTAKRKKTDEDLLAIRRLEFEGGMYFDEAVGPYVPSHNVRRSFIEGARLTKRGKDVERAFIVLDPIAPLRYDGPRDIETMFEQRMYDARTVRVSQSRILRVRPRFDPWELTFRAELLSDYLSVPDLQTVASTAGLMIGLCDYRERFGRYSVEIS